MSFVKLTHAGVALLSVVSCRPAPRQPLSADSGLKKQDTASHSVEAKKLVPTKAEAKLEVSSKHNHLEDKVATPAHPSEYLQVDNAKITLEPKDCSLTVEQGGQVFQSNLASVSPCHLNKNTEQTQFDVVEIKNRPGKVLLIASFTALKDTNRCKTVIHSLRITEEGPRLSTRTETPRTCFIHGLDRYYFEVLSYDDAPMKRREVP